MNAAKVPLRGVSYGHLIKPYTAIMIVRYTIGMNNSVITTIEQKDFAAHPLLSRLLELHDIPKRIHIQGKLPDITLDEYGRAIPRILTVVGSRKNTTYGRQALEMLLTSLQGENVVPKHLVAVMDVLGQAGAHFGRRIEDYEGKTANSLTIKLPGELNPVNITALPYPGFPTDVQAQMMSLMSLAKGTSIITDKVFPDRFMHVAELNRLAAHIQKEGQSAIIEGVSELSGADVMASDLRASASLVLAGLAAKGQTTVFRIYHLDRGYANLEQKLQSLGAKVKREKE